MTLTSGTSGFEDAGGFLLKARLTSGQTLEATVPQVGLEFAGMTVEGLPVRVQVTDPPVWSSADLACEIVRVRERGILVVRAWNWTGELKAIWQEMAVRNQSGRTFVVRGSEVVEAYFYCRRSRAPGRAAR